MNKNQKNSLILVIVIVVVFVLAYFGYNKLSANGPNVSYSPTISVDDEKINDLESKSKDLTSSNNSTTKDDATNQDSSSSDSIEADDNQQAAATSDSSKDNSVSDDNQQENENIMPDIPLTLLNGEETTFWELAELGKPVVINSFASWCPPCQSEMPDFIAASEEYKGEVTFIFFDSFDGERETMENLEAFADKYFNDDTICVIDPGYISYLFKSNSLPTTILLNKEGTPVNGYQGMVAKETLINAIEQLLAE